MWSNLSHFSREIWQLSKCYGKFALGTRTPNRTLGHPVARAREPDRWSSCFYVVNGRFTAERSGNWLRSWRMKATRRRSVNIGGGGGGGPASWVVGPPSSSPRRRAATATHRRDELLEFLRRVDPAAIHHLVSSVASPVTTPRTPRVASGSEAISARPRTDRPLPDEPWNDRDGLRTKSINPRQPSYIQQSNSERLSFGLPHALAHSNSETVRVIIMIHLGN